mgnify:CR=1 FL=1
MKRENNIEKIYNEFKKNLFAIEVYFVKIGELANNQDEKDIKKSNEYLDKLFEEIGIDLDEKESSKKELKIPTKKLYEFARKFKKRPKVSLQHYDILAKSSFLLLNSYFEYLLTDLMKYYYLKYKESIGDKDLKISLTELSEYNSIEELKEHLVLKEVESLLLELSFDKLLEHFKTDLSIDLNDKHSKWEAIGECRERRHLIVHNGSIINKKYISRTNNPFKFKIGDSINISKDYFLQVYYEIKLAGFLLIFNCWGKWNAENATNAIKELMFESFEFLNLNKDELTVRICKYADQIQARNEEQSDFLMRIKFNKCIAFHRLKMDKELKKELDQINVGTSEPIFKLAYSILINEKPDKIKELVKSCILLKDISMDSYQNWPIFKLLKPRRKLNKEIMEIMKREITLDKK